MHPANHDLAAQVREQATRQVVQQPTSQASSSQVSRVRSLRSEESWIDVSSRNSSSSLSSAAGEDTLTPGRGLAGTASSRRRRLQRSYSGQTHRSNATYMTTITDSSQEEYDESESEQDQIMTSSNEDLQRGGDPSETVQMRRPVRRVPSSLSSDTPSMNSSADGTTLNVGQGSESRLAASFRPQPNAFTRPPVSRHANSYQPEPTSYFSAIATAPMTRATTANAAFPQPQSQVSTPSPGTPYANPPTTMRTRNHTPYNIISPTHNVSVDHDAALRASLSTLLSCAAARRGVPKRENLNAPLATGPPGQQITQGTLCLIPESELDKESHPVAVRNQTEERSRLLDLTRQEEIFPSRQKSPRRKSKSKSPSRSPHRRKARAVNPASAAPKAADLDSTSLSPTTLWLLGVGALFLGGAVLFTAGYIQGREVGYAEGFSDASAASCRNEATADGLRGMGRRGWRSATAGASIWGVS